jgi:predicted small integral membrane protein
MYSGAIWYYLKAWLLKKTQIVTEFEAPVPYNSQLYASQSQLQVDTLFPDRTLANRLADWWSC